jgi:HPt (histidine-containing phosphotransfer) domain-containing protein
MNEYISKPIREDELFKIINNVLRSKGGMTNIKNENINIPVQNGDLLNLDYLREVSGGDSSFEKNMMEQFLEQVPGELEAMQEAFSKANYPELKHIAHNLKTSVSFMGLTKTLDNYLDYIESNAGIQSVNDNLEEKIIAVNKICQHVIREVTDYLEQMS